jgi:hypothetical protein
MDVTLPIGPVRRLTIAWTRRAGLRAGFWRRERYLATWGTLPPWFDRGDDGGAGVREPRRPLPSDRGGALGLSPGEPD